MPDTPKRKAKFERRRVLPLAVSLAGGALWAACFQPDSRPWLACVALVPLCWLALTRASFKWGVVHGVVFWALSMNWLAATLTSYGGLDPVLSWILLGCFSVFFGLEHGLFLWLIRFTCGSNPSSFRLSSVPMIMATWVLLEVQRGFLWRGFPWNLAAGAWTDLDGALALAPWLGSFGVSAVVIAVNAGVAVTVFGSTRKTKLHALVAAVATPLALVLVLSFSWNPKSISADEDTRGGQGTEVLEVRIVQPNSPIVDRSQAADNYRRLIDLSTAACDRKALLVWPESAAWPEYVGSPAGRLDRDLAKLNSLGCGVLVNSVTARQGRWQNSAILVDQTGHVGQYSKRRLVPWGEYVPLATWFPFIGRLARNAGDFVPGDDLGLIPWRNETLAVAICYEIVFAAAVAEQVRAGATVLLTVTNDAWYGDTAAPWQHFRAAQWRAAENRRPVLRAALTGVSAVIAADGSIEQLLTIDRSGVLSATVEGNSRVTLFSRAPWAIPLLSSFVLVFGIVRARNRRRPR